LWFLRTENDSNVSNPATSASNCNKLEPLQTIALGPSARCRVNIVYTPGEEDNDGCFRPRRSQAILIHLVECDPALLPARLQATAALPVREYSIGAVVCKSDMSLPQRHMDLGPLHKFEPISKKFLLENVSDAPLLYQVRKKQHNFESSQLKFDKKDEIGIVPPLGSREISFVFKPTLPGNFNITFALENVLTEVEQTITVKAQLIRPDNFWLQSLSLDFGSLQLNHTSEPQLLVVCNISDSTRTIKIFAPANKAEFLEGAVDMDITFQLESTVRIVSLFVTAYSHAS
jgi:hypothetical protein